MTKSANIFNSKKLTLLILFIYAIKSCNNYYCSGKSPKNSTECNELSTFTYQCCYLEGSNVVTSLLRYKVCYGFPQGRDPKDLPTPNFSPNIKIDLIECGTPLNNAIKKVNLCGIDSPGNATICSFYGSNCCYLKYMGDSFCLDKNNFKIENYEDVNLECHDKFIFIFKMYFYILILILFLF